MRVGEVRRDKSGAVWVVGGLPLAVAWAERGSPLYLQTYPWPGDESGVREPVSTDRYADFRTADDAARRFIRGLPG